MDEIRRQWLTLGLMVVIALFTIASDVWLMKTYGVNASYSRVTGHMFDQYPIVMAVTLIAIGCLIGHVLMPAHPR